MARDELCDETVFKCSALWFESLSLRGVSLLSFSRAERFVIAEALCYLLTFRLFYGKTFTSPEYYFILPSAKMSLPSMSFSSQARNGNTSRSFFSPTADSRAANKDTAEIRQHLNSALDIIKQTAKGVLEYTSDFEDQSLMHHCDELKAMFRQVLEIDDSLSRHARRYQSRNAQVSNKLDS